MYKSILLTLSFLFQFVAYLSTTPLWTSAIYTTSVRAPDEDVRILVYYRRLDVAVPVAVAAVLLSGACIPLLSREGRRAEFALTYGVATAALAAVAGQSVDPLVMLSIGNFAASLAPSLWSVAFCVASSACLMARFACADNLFWYQLSTVLYLSYFANERWGASRKAAFHDALCLLTRTVLCWSLHNTPEASESISPTVFPTPQEGFITIGRTTVVGIAMIATYDGFNAAYLYLDQMHIYPDSPMEPMQANRVSIANNTLVATPVVWPNYRVACGFPLQLADDRILLVGGIQSAAFGLDGRHHITMYDPATASMHGVAMMTRGRYYASALMLGVDHFMVIGYSPTVDVFSTNGTLVDSFPLHQPMVDQSPHHPDDGFIYYPGAYLLPTGHVLVFSCRMGIIMTTSGTVVATLPSLQGTAYAAESCVEISGAPVLIRGEGSVTLVYFGGYMPGGNADTFASRQSIRLHIQYDPTYSFGPWEIEDMPLPRLHPSAVLLPNGNIVIVNGMQKGVTGYHNAKLPILEAWLYSPRLPLGQRYSVLASTTIPRMYHSTAILALPGGEVLVSGCSSCSDADVDGPDTHRMNKANQMDEHRTEMLRLGRFKRDAPMLVSAPLTVAFSAPVRLRIACPSRGILRPVLFQAGADSHGVNLNQKLVHMVGKCNVCGLCTVHAPPRNSTLPGTYWLFLVRERDGAFSDGRPTRIT